MFASSQSGRTPRPLWRWGYLAWGLCTAVATLAARHLAGDLGMVGMLAVVTGLGAMMGWRRTPGVSLPQHVLPIWIRQIEGARRHADASVEALLESFAVVSMQVDDPALHEELEKIAMDLQSHDRVSQMLTAVTDDMHRLVSWWAGAPDDAAADSVQWLARLEASYPMADMTARHHNQAVVDKPSGVQFF